MILMVTIAFWGGGGLITGCNTNNIIRKANFEHMRNLKCENHLFNINIAN